MRRREGLPVWVAADGAARTLARVDLGSTATSRYDEAWLQRLLFEQPQVFPIEQIEPGFGELVPLCRELPLMFGAGRTGALDNLFVTREGGLVIVEAKLWRNPQARREVVAQAMEYAGAIFRMDYGSFESLVLKARRSDGASEGSLYDLASGPEPVVGEAEFVDAVARNLSRGRAVIAVVGDGIREDIAPLAEMLQSHAGQRFTFALVELAIFEAPDDVRVVVPSVLAKTVLIERGVVRVEGAEIRIDPPRANLPGATSAATGLRRAVSIGEDEFYDILAQKDPAAPEFLRRFLEKADDLGVYVDRQAGLNLKHRGAGSRPLNLGTIRKDGFLDTGPASWWGRTQPAKIYDLELAQAIGGKVVDMMNGEQCALRTAADKTPRLTELLPAHEQTWLSAMERYIRTLVESEGEEP